MAQFLSSKYVEALIFVAVMLGILKITGHIFTALKKKKNNSVMAFLEGIARALIIIAIAVRILNLWSGFSKFSSQILMSSSLLVVVLGFVFQEGLSNIVHGFILLMFKPFDIGDRVRITVDGSELSGYVKNINLRSTEITNLVSSATVIVPNAKMDTVMIENMHYEGSNYNTGLLDFSVTYESNLEKAIRIASDTVAQHPLVKKARSDKGETRPVGVIVRDLGDSGIYLRCSVLTHTAEENYQACSDIRLDLYHRFLQEKDVDFAYPHMQIVKESSAGTNLERKKVN